MFRILLRPRPALRQWTRLQSSSANVSVPRRNYIWSHLLAGIAGGGIVVGAGYTWYYFSGIKRAVDASKHITEYLKKTKQMVVEKHPNEAMNYLRTIAKSYAAIIPGSSFVVDKMFDSMDEIVEEHSEEASTILLRAQQEIEEILKRKAELSKVELASEILGVVGQRMNEISKLGAKARGNIMEKANGAIRGFAVDAWKKRSKDDDNDA